MTPNFCHLGGRVVGADVPLPGESHEHDAGGHSVGCNHLVCSECASAVRQGAGYAWTELEPSVLHAAPDWGALANAGDIGTDRSERMYACACHVHFEDGDRLLSDAQDWDHHQPPPPWRCGGHASPALPYILDGVVIDDIVDADELVRSASITPPSSAPTYAREPSDWLLRLASLWRNEPVGARVLHAISTALTHPDVRVRAAVSLVYRDHPGLPGGELVASTLHERTALWLQVPHPSGHGWLHTALEVAAARRATWRDPLGSFMDEPAAEVLKELALTPHDLAQTVLVALAEVQADWLVQHAGRIYAVDPQPKRARDLLYALGKASVDVTPAVRDMLAVPGVPTETLMQLTRQLARVAWQQLDAAAPGKTAAR